MRPGRIPIEVRNTKSEDFDEIIQICREVYKDAYPWSKEQLSSHIKYFPEGQFVAVRSDTGEIIGMAASLIVNWADYDINDNYREFVAGGTFENHDPEGRTLYGAEVMVKPSYQGTGVGGAIYEARRRLVQDLGLLRIRAGARLQGYHRYAGEMSAQEYAIRVIRREIWDSTISFQMKHGFVPLKLVENYFYKDPECLGYALVIEWLNPEVATPQDFELQELTAKRYLSWRVDGQ